LLDGMKEKPYNRMWYPGIIEIYSERELKFGKNRIEKRKISIGEK
jgi:hypothetical protein